MNKPNQISDETNQITQSQHPTNNSTRLSIRRFNIFENLIKLFYPRVCLACGNSLLRQEESICMTCRYLLPKTGYEKVEDNPLAQSFYGQVPFHAVTAQYFFSKSGKIQNLIHELKYKGSREAGIFLGEELGKSLLEAHLFQSIDYIVPIPLHPKKEAQRGFNQSHVIAQGVQKTMNVPIAERCMIRKVHTSTQTKKTREERIENVKDIFELKNEEILVGKHVLLLDDVHTTGATLMAGGKTLMTIPKIIVSAATIACAVK